MHPVGPCMLLVILRLHLRIVCLSAWLSHGDVMLGATTRVQVSTIARKGTGPMVLRDLKESPTSVLLS